MPVVLRDGAFRFFFYANEHLPRHIHIDCADGWGRLDLENMAWTKCEMNQKTASSAMKIAKQHRTQLIRSWNDYFGKD